MYFEDYNGTEARPKIKTIFVQVIGWNGSRKKLWVDEACQGFWHLKYLVNKWRKDDLWNMNKSEFKNPATMLRVDQTRLIVNDIIVLLG